MKKVYIFNVTFNDSYEVIISDSQDDKEAYLLAKKLFPNKFLNSIKYLCSAWIENIQMKET